MNFYSGYYLVMSIVMFFFVYNSFTGYSVVSQTVSFPVVVGTSILTLGVILYKWWVDKAS